MRRTRRCPLSANSGHQVIRAGLLLVGRYGRGYCVLIGVSAGTNSVIAMFAGERGLTTGGFVIERQTVELVLLRRRNCDVTISPAVVRG